MISNVDTNNDGKIDYNGTKFWIDFLEFCFVFLFA
jgi:hypothetical protein